MSATVFKTPAAYDDLDAIASYIQQYNPNAAHRFLSAAEKSFNLLASQPLLGEAFPHAKYSDLRLWTLSRRFRNHVIFYRPVSEGVEIVRVLHGAQDLPSVLGK